METGMQNVHVSSGIFSHVIKLDISKVDLRKGDIWLEVVVDGKTLSPREKLYRKSMQCMQIQPRI